MQRLLSVRITRIEAKFAYVLALAVISNLLFRFIPEVGSHLTDALQLAGIWYGSRVFRSFGETVAPPRAWWRMTAWRTASGWIGVLAIIGLVLSIAWDVQALAGVEGVPPYEPAKSLSVTVFSVVVAFFYLNSWARLRRLGIRKPPPLRPIGKNVMLTPPKLP